MRKALAPPPPRASHAGSGGSTSSVSAEDSDSLSGESLEGRMEISVVLPGGKVVRMPVERRTPMMDLLVQVTKANNLSPAAYLLDICSERGRTGATQYKPSTAVGTLSPTEVHVVARAAIKEAAPPQKASVKTAGKTPFEKTFRLRVHLPRNQLHVIRVSGNAGLASVFAAICDDRDLNATRYELRHPVHTEEKLDPQRSLADYGLTEVAVVPIKSPSSGYSRLTTDIMALHPDEERKKRSFFGFLYRKSKSSIGDTSSDGHSSRGVSPARSSDGSERQSISPPPRQQLSTSTLTVNQTRPPAPRVAMRASTSTTDLTNNKINKRKAPPPPLPPPPVLPAPSGPEVKVNQGQNGKSQGRVIVEQAAIMSKPEIEVEDCTTESNHSRHSSDSSGYHEASVLCESPETTGGVLDGDGSTSRTVNVIVHSNSPVSPTSSNLTMVNSTSTLSIGSGGNNNRKRKAPPPPRPLPPGTSGNAGGAPPVPTTAQVPQLPEVANEDDAEAVAPPPVTTSQQPSTKRRDSVSSYASSTSEEVKAIAATSPTTASTKGTAPPVPLPRLSKTPTTMANGGNDIIDDDIKSNDVPDASRRSSSKSESERSTPLAEATNADVDANDTINRNVSVTSSVVTSSAMTSSTVISTSRRSSDQSTSSKQSVASQKSSGSRQKIAAPDDRRVSVNSVGSGRSSTSSERNGVVSTSRKSSVTEVTTTSTFTKEIAAAIHAESRRRSSATSSLGSDTPIDLPPMPVVSTENPADDDRRDSRTSSRLDSITSAADMASWRATWSDDERKRSTDSSSLRSSRGSNTPEFDLTVIPPPAFLDDGDHPQQLNEEEEEEEVEETSGSGGAIHYDADFNEFHNESSNRMKQSIANQWARLISLPPSTEETGNCDDWVDDEDGDEDPPLLQIEGADSANFAEIFQKDAEAIVNEELAINDAERRRSSDASSSRSGASNRSQPAVAPPAVVATTASESHDHQKDIAAEIDEAFASINYSSSEDEAEETREDKRPPSSATTDPVITWEYHIPEPPPEFRNDLATPLPEQTDTCHTETASVCSDPGPRSLAAAAAPTEESVALDVSRLSKVEPTPEMQLEKEEEERPVVRRYRRPVVNFSISTYRSRAEEENGYDQRLSRPDLVSVPLARPLRRSESAMVTSPPTNGVPKFSIQSAGQSAAIIDAVTGGRKVPVKVEPNREDAIIRRTTSELQLSNNVPPSVAPDTVYSDKKPEQANVLQEEYVKLHQQFLHWQQQLLQNQTVLQQQQVVPAASADDDTLRRIRDMQQQFSSLPPMIITNAPAPNKPAPEPAQTPLRQMSTPDDAPPVNSSDYVLRSMSLPRPKPAPSNPAPEPTTERTLPRVGPRPWRPVSVAVGSWQSSHRANGAPVSLGVVPETSIVIPPPSVTVAPIKSDSAEVPSSSISNPSASIRDRISSINVRNAAPTDTRVGMGRPLSQGSFPRNPTVKGFVLDPQPKSKVIIGPASTGPAMVPKTGVVRVNVGSSKPAPSVYGNTSGQRVTAQGQSTVTYLGDPSQIAIVSNGKPAPVRQTSAGINGNSDKTTSNGGGKFTSVVSVSQKRQQVLPTGGAPPPPPPPPPAAPSSPMLVAPKTANSTTASSRNSSRRSSTSPPGSTVDVRDELMGAIREFGGRTGLRKVDSSETRWQSWHGGVS